MNFINKIKSGGKKKDSSSKLYMKEPYISGTLVNGSLKILVTLPKFVDLNEWLAVNTFDFFFYGNLFFGAVAEFCTVKDCPIMSSGPGFEYTWTDSQKKTIKLPGPQYIDYVMTWIQNLIDDESIFPTKAGIEFQKDFQIQIKVIYKQLFRVFAHIYYAHYEKILNLSAEGHLNTLFAHFVCFAKEFDLLDRKEMAPMNDFIVELEASGRI